MHQLLITKPNLDRYVKKKLKERSNGGGGGDEVSSVWRGLRRKDAPTPDYKTKPGSTALGLDARLLPRSVIS